VLNQQLGLASNGRDAADRIREESLRDEAPPEEGYETRDAARDRFELSEENDRLRPVVVDTRRGFDQFQKIREALARLELTDGFDFARLALEMAPRLPRDATIIAVLPRVPVESAIALGTLRRQGFAITAVLIGLDESEKLEAHGRLLAQTVRDIRYVNTEEELAHLGGNTAAGAPATYGVEVPLA
jgi:rhodanese-related sulfurtransferase